MLRHDGSCRSRIRRLGTAALGCLAAATLSASVGLLLACGSAYAYLVGAMEAWQEVPLPLAVRASMFVLSDTPTAYVETTDGRLFGQGPNLTDVGVEVALESGWDNDSWREVDHVVNRDPAEPHRGECSRSGGGFHRWSAWRKPRETVEDQVYCILFVHSEAAVYSSYVLMENGGVWRWSRQSSGLGGFVILI